MADKKGKSSGTRTLQSKSAARIIIIDLCECEPPLGENLSQALCEFLVLHNSLPGMPKIQLLALFLIGDTIECPVQFQNTKANLPKMLQAVKDLACQEMARKGGREKFEENLAHVLMESFAQFQRLHKSSDKGLPSGPQVDICLFTSQRKGLIEKQVALALKECDLTIVKKLQLVHIASSVASDTALPSSPESSDSQDSGITEILCGYIESLFLENNVLSLEQYFKTWLQDVGSDDVHLVVEFGGDEEEQGFDLKCDLIDVLINPLKINGGQGLVLQTDLDFSPTNTSLSSKSKQLGKLNVYVLRPKGFVKLKNVCESVLYGLPRVVKPTTCWQLDWEELERNQCQFEAIRAYMFQQDLCVLLEQDNQVLQSYFIMLPSPSSSMLIKSVAVRDLLMPTESAVTSTHVGEHIAEQVQKRLDKIPVVDEYNPFSFSSGLFSRMLTQPNNSKGGTSNQSWRNTTTSRTNVKDKPITTQSKSQSKKVESRKPKAPVRPKNSTGAAFRASIGAGEINSSMSPLSFSDSENNPCVRTNTTPKKLDERTLGSKFDLLPPGLNISGLSPTTPPPPIIRSPLSQVSPRQPPSKETATKYVPRFNVRSKNPSSSTSAWSVNPSKTSSSTSKSNKRHKFE